jgi:hypothetical protein
MTGFLTRKDQFDDGNRAWSHAVMSQGASKIVLKTRNWKDSFIGLRGSLYLDNTLM